MTQTLWVMAGREELVSDFVLRAVKRQTCGHNSYKAIAFGVFALLKAGSGSQSVGHKHVAESEDDQGLYVVLYMLQ